MSKKIMLDAGHYGKYNQSPVVSAYYESEVMWKLHLLLKAALEDYGFTVGTTRTNQAKDMDVYTRGKSAKGYDLLLSLHSNATDKDRENIDYPVSYVSIDGKGNAIGQKLACEVERIMGTKQKGQIQTRINDKGGDYYGITNGAKDVGSIGVILEHSFHTQTAATKWLLSDTNLRKLADAEATVIAAHFGAQKPKPVPAITPKADTVKFDLFGEIVNISGTILDGLTYVQARQLLEKMDYVVGWDDAKKTVTVRLKQTAQITPAAQILLEKIGWAEARGEDLKGQTLIINVILNRVNSKGKGFPDTIKEVIYQKEPSIQFTPVYDVKTPFEDIIPTETNKQAVQKALSGEDYSQGALYFCSLASAAKPDSWHEKKLTRLFVHGGHIFYK